MERRTSFEITSTAVTARAWLARPGLAHAFSTRSVERDEFFGRFGGLQPILMHQVHSDRVHPLEQAPAGTLRGDAMITDRPGLALVIKTADCLPLLLFDPERPAVGAAHAGWRGTLARIAEKTAGAMRAHYGSDPTRLEAVIGPGIGRCCYEVGHEVIDKFRTQFAYADDLFAELDEENPADIYLPRQVMIDGQSFLRNLAPAKAFLDLVEANRRQLIEAGVSAEKIVTGAPCTACDTRRFYSYRREGRHAGRLYALIGITPKSKDQSRKAKVQGPRSRGSG